MVVFEYLIQAFFKRVLSKTALGSPPLSVKEAPRNKLITLKRKNHNNNILILGAFIMIKIQPNTLHWLKAIAIVAALLFTRAVFATDSIETVPELGKQASSWMEVLKFFAKWGGITVIVGVVLAIGAGKAKGNMAQMLCGLAFMIGGLAAAWGYFTTSFTQGFVF